jgi:hypothetical protein
MVLLDPLRPNRVLIDPLWDEEYCSDDDLQKILKEDCADGRLQKQEEEYERLLESEEEHSAS